MSTPWCTGGGATDCGPRGENQDAYLSAGRVHIVADGMGGHVGGAAAAQAVIEAFRPLAGAPVATPADVKAAVERARSLVADVSHQAGGEAGATLSGAVAVEHDGEPWWMVINVGDSRVYALEGGALRQVTVDHSHVQELVDAGRITPAEAESHPDRNLVTRAIGDSWPGFDGWLVRARPGLRLVVASDGLMKVIADARIASIAALAGTADAAAQRLVAAALEAGTTDNVTVVVADTLHAQTPRDASPAPWTAWGEDALDDDDTTVSGRARVDA
ncbi:PP2C family protein-serine/threonine phosphatase [Demequina activiva]|uniref:Serine/threonine protein phosphatase n=1 Tax=Demequina activiva TaxID=1582364 RepID=A0A919UFW1_9MICO|nr:protein phosphatase 2C domain-containing protein [Demequina activiva]GIG54162.1 serine/threonine protein phosphatase [Demequina activiva]